MGTHVTWLFHMCRDLFIRAMHLWYVLWYGPCLFDMCYHSDWLMPLAYVLSRAITCYHSFIRAITLSYMPWFNRRYVPWLVYMCHDSFICATWLIRMNDMTNSYTPWLCVCVQTHDCVCVCRHDCVCVCRHMTVCVCADNKHQVIPSKILWMKCRSSGGSSCCRSSLSFLPWLHMCHHSLICDMTYSCVNEVQEQ